MIIKDFDRLRAGDNFPVSIDIDKINSHESIGIAASVYLYRCDTPGKKDTHRAEVRLMDQRVYLLVYGYEDMTPPIWLEKSTLVWESHPIEARAALTPRKE